MRVSRWLATQQQDWDRLAAGQRERLAQLGVNPAPRPAAPARKARTGQASGSAFARGIAALTQYKERERKVVVSRSWEEELPDGTSVRLGVWLSNTRARRAGLTHGQREQLASLGVDWAV